MKSGIELIAAERQRQIEKEGFDADHDEQHNCGELAEAAACYAAPEPVYVVRTDQGSISFFDLWPDNWDLCWDKRKRNSKDQLIFNKKLPKKERIRNLVKAGALIAAEIDRLSKTTE